MGSSYFRCSVYFSLLDTDQLCVLTRFCDAREDQTSVHISIATGRGVRTLQVFSVTLIHASQALFVQVSAFRI